LDQVLAKTASPPVAQKRPVASERHGERRVDDYAWLRAENWQEVMRDPDSLPADIRAYLEAENAHTASMLAPLDGLRARLFAEMKGRIKEDDSTVPARDGAYSYFTRHETDGQHPVFCRSRADGSGEEVLLDGNVEARRGGSETRPYFRVASCEHSPDHRRLAYTVDFNGSEYHTVHLRDLATGEDRDERITNAQGDIVWANDSRTLFYTALDEHHRPCRVYRHVLGEDPANDVLVHEDPDPAFYLSISQTESRRFVLIEAYGHSTTSEVRCIDADAPASAPFLIAARETGHLYDVSHQGDRFIIRTNADGAEDFKIVESPVASPGRANWRELVPHEAGRLIRFVYAFRNHLVRLERENGLPRIVVTRMADGAEHAIEFDEEAYNLGIEPGYEFDTTNLRFTYSSMTTPERTYDYDMELRTRVMRKEQIVPSGHDPSAYVTRRVFAPAHDGKRVPVSLLYRKDTKLDGAAPLLLYGYGSYGIAIPAAFGANRLSLVDRGFVFAIAHIRGGTDLGYGWYLDGKLAKKTNTFRDFIAAAEHLIDAGFTKKGAIVAQGGSAGGMLMGAVANLRPDLFRGIVAEVPFVDVLNTMCDATLPLTPPEWAEWGNPIEDAELHRTIASYSPYDNVRAQAYPDILATCGLTDPRVTYWEPAKWVAKLRALKTNDAVVMLRTNMGAGHAGAAGRFDKLEEIALVYAFALWVAGKAG
jgi:oligopeptidase B